MQGDLTAPGVLQCDHEADAAIESGDWQQGLIAHEQLLARDPANCLALFHLGYIWGVSGERRKEIEYYDKAEACGFDRDEKLYFNLGMALAATGDLPAAHRAMQKAIDLKPDNADNHFGLGLISGEAGLMDQAMHAYQKAVALNPRHWEAHVALVRLYMDQGRWQAAHDRIRVLEQGSENRAIVQELREILERRRIGEDPSESRSDT